MHYWRCIRSVALSDLTLFIYYFFKIPEVDKLWQSSHLNLTGLGSRQGMPPAGTRAWVLCLHTAWHPQETEKTTPNPPTVPRPFSCSVRKFQMFSTTVSCGTIETRPIMHREPKDMDFNSKKRGGGTRGHTLWFLLPVCSVLVKKKKKKGPSAFGIKYR